MNDHSSLLYAHPSFLKGVARMLDVLGGLDQYNTSESDQQADRRALRSDWQAVGDDIESAMKVVAKDLPEQGTNG